MHGRLLVTRKMHTTGRRRAAPQLAR